jgi:peroxiredoxin
MAGIYRERINKIIEQAVNVAIIVIAMVLAGMFIRNYLPVKSNVRQTVSIGNRLDVQPIRWSSNTKNIVLVLSTTCKYCKASAGFYQRLARECEDRHIRTIALFPQSVEQSRAYLESEGVRVTEIWQAEPGKLKVQGTPTVLLVDNNGIVQHVWTGKLPANQEKDLLATLGL